MNRFLDTGSPKKTQVAKFGIERQKCMLADRIIIQQSLSGLSRCMF